MFCPNLNGTRGGGGGQGSRPLPLPPPYLPLPSGAARKNFLFSLPPLSLLPPPLLPLPLTLSAPRVL